MLILFWLQVLAGSCALQVPLCIGGIFYIGIAYSWRYGIIWAVLSGISLDLAYGREFFLAAWAFPAAAVFAEYWRRKNETRYLRNCVLPGIVIALVSILPVWIYKLLLYDADPGAAVKELLPVTIFTSGINAWLLPLLVLILDRIGKQLKLPLFTRAGKRRPELRDRL